MLPKTLKMHLPLVPILRSWPPEQTLKQASELLAINRLFRNAGIELLTIKGVLLALDLYGDLAARASKDIDLVVKVGDVRLADELLLARGYFRQYLSSRQLKSHQTQSKDFVYWHPQKRICVELHWRLFQDWDCFDPFNVPHQKIVLGGQVFSTLSPEYNLLYLATHGCESGWLREQWLLDIMKLLEKYGPSLDWGLIWREAKRYDLTGPLEQALKLPSPPARGQGEGRGRVKYVWQSSVWFSKIMLRKRWKNRAKAAWSLLVPRAQDFQALRLPDWLFFLYPLVRPWLALARNRQRSKASSQRA